MCTSIVRNGDRTIVGFNLDIMNLTYRVNAGKEHVWIEIADQEFGWLPLFGVNDRGDFVAMPTCYPYDPASEKGKQGEINILQADIDLLLKKKSLQDINTLAKEGKIYSLPGITWQVQLTNRAGDVLRHTPGQGYEYLEKPKYSVMTNFSPWKRTGEEHPWSGRERYERAMTLLAQSSEPFGAKDALEILKQLSQEECKTVVSIVYDAMEHAVYWCEQRRWESVFYQKLE